MERTESPHEVRQWFLGEVRKLWPLASGSLSLRSGPCVRENCSACARGQGHASYALYGRSPSGRFSVYIPQELVPQVQQAVDNGRKLQRLMREAGLRYTAALKQQRSAGSSVRERRAR